VTVASVLIAEDEDVLRRNLTFILNSSGYSAVSVRSSVDAIASLRKRPFNVVITDLLMPGMGGSELMRYVSENCPETAVIVITAYPSAESAIDAVKKGVSDYFTKPFKTDDIIRAVAKAVENQRSVPIHWDRLSRMGITKREEEMLMLMVEDGITENLEMAERLQIKPATIKQHLENLYGKFGVGNKASLVSAVFKELRK
jgi:DNA-binding NarL/FixJ family response regulator